MNRIFCVSAAFAKCAKKQKIKQNFDFDFAFSRAQRCLEKQLEQCGPQVAAKGGVVGGWEWSGKKNKKQTNVRQLNGNEKLVAFQCVQSEAMEQFSCPKARDLNKL